MKTEKLVVLLVIVLLSGTLIAQKKSNKKVQSPKVSSLLKLSNSTSQLSIDLNGGAIVDFHLKSNKTNPFNWKLAVEQMPQNNKSGAVFQGHFLCLGRWGAPTDGEIKAGVPHNGQASRDNWTQEIIDIPTLLKISSKAPLDGIEVERTVQIDPINAIYKVTEQVRNVNSVGRLFNIIQHATIGPPFLDSTTIIDSNAKEGFMQSMAFPKPTAFEYLWPNAYIDSTKATLNLTKSDTEQSYVSTHIFSDSIGWVTASSPQSGILLGYVWKTKNYPWLNLWHQRVDGRLWAKGLEFGTAGIGKSYQDLLSVDTSFHGRTSFFFLDATVTIEKSYICFQIPITADFKGVDKIILTLDKLQVVEKGNLINSKLVIHQNLRL